MPISNTNSNITNINRGLVLGVNTNIGYSNNLSANNKGKYLILGRVDKARQEGNKR
jgi:hypothetical protein